MKSIKYLLTLAIAFLTITYISSAFSPKGKEFGFGIMIGEPTGLTGKLWVAKDQALAFSVGNSYLGSLRVGVDYLFHFDAFNSKVVNMYGGPGLAFGFGESGGWWYHDEHNKYWYKKDNEIGFGVRGVFGINIVPKKTPFEIFAEIGVLVGILPATHTNAEGSLGIRFYF
jgi:hypothetical protein